MLIMPLFTFAVIASPARYLFCHAYDFAFDADVLPMPALAELSPCRFSLILIAEISLFRQLMLLLIDFICRHALFAAFSFDDIAACC